VALVESFYAGLGADTQAVTAAIRRRDLAIARQLVAAGATPDEAQDYARETSAVPGRLAPVDLRSFERERLGRRARRQREDRRHVDRTGLPPTWLDGAPAEPARAVPLPRAAPPPPRADTRELG
jgi:hypothetical protein